MTGLREDLAARLRDAFGAIDPGADPVLRPSEHADFQANGALALAKRVGRPPRELAAEIVAQARLDAICESVEVSGPGFVNLRIAAAHLAVRVTEMAADERLGIPRATSPERFVVDYSAPNVAKEMHAGHLRSTIIGDALCRLLAFAGHVVVRENHVGDWGTPFGMLIEHLVDVGEERSLDELSVGDLNDFYRAARASFDASEPFRERSRRRVVALQSGDPESVRLWRALVAVSLRSFAAIYRRLGVLLEPDDIAGESSYADRLEPMMAELAAAGLVEIDEGATCVFPEGFTNREGARLPLIVRKSDEGYGYAATDLAAIRDRVTRLGATGILYVVGGPQAQHFAMCFAVARMAGWLHDGVSAAHVGFGNMLGADRKMFRTRQGDTVRLAHLIDEAEARAAAILEEKGVAASLGADAAQGVAHAVGIGALKYADLSNDRMRDYVFDWDRMLSFDGDTAPYLQYAHARIRSIFRKGAVAAPEPGRVHLALAEAPERALALELASFDAAIADTIEGFAPHRLCGYLYGLATRFSAFYESCPVLGAAPAELRSGRLLLCDVTARVLAKGLDLLGIEAPERM